MVKGKARLQKALSFPLLLLPTPLTFYFPVSKGASNIAGRKILF